jgi:crotonobetaine/carnitine-CoA ligase
MCNSAAWISVVFRALVAGVPFALDPSFSVTAFWERTRHFGATQTFTLGAMHLFLWQAPQRDDDAQNPIRSMGAIPMPDAILEPFKVRFGIESIQQGYGQSEVMGLLSRVDDPGEHWNPGSVGVPLPGIEVRLLNDEDRQVPPGEVGEFCVRPTEPNVLFNGYFGDPAATVAATRNLWYHTGDLGRLDGDAQFHFVDRKRDLIRYKGRSVSSMAVEQAVRAHPHVREAAAYGIATTALTSEAEIMVAVVLEPDEDVDPAELARFVNDHAPYYLVPRYIDIVSELPHTPTGKIQKFDVRARGVTASTWDREASGFVLER